MLDESGLSKAFWAECLAALVHVLNRCITSSVAHATPYEVWHRRKPDVGHLRVWGCVAYVHIQKDKREHLGSHMEKCVFIGYPDGYKGWKFYNPKTKKVIICERADFDERYTYGGQLLNGITPEPPVPTPKPSQQSAPKAPSNDNNDAQQRVVDLPAVDEDISDDDDNVKEEEQVEGEAQQEQEETPEPETPHLVLVVEELHLVWMIVMLKQKSMIDQWLLEDQNATSDLQVNGGRFLLQLQDQERQLLMFGKCEIQLLL